MTVFWEKSKSRARSPPSSSAVSSSAFSGWVGTVPGTHGEGKDQPRHVLAPSQPDASGTAPRSGLPVALVGVGDGLASAGPDREGVGGSPVLRGAVGRPGGETEGRSPKAQANLGV